MSKSLLTAGEECRVLTLETGLTDYRINVLGDARVIALPCLLKRFYIPRVSFKYIQQIVDDVDVIHLIGHWTVLNALVYRAAKKSGKPYVVCPAGALAIFGRSKFIKFVYNLIIGKNIIKNANACIAVTADEKDYFVSFGILNKDVVVIPNGIAEDDFKSADVNGFREKNSLGGRPFILFVGRLNLIKGPDLLLQAFRDIKDRYKDVDLVLVGPDGGLQHELKRYVQMEGMEGRVHFIGYVGGADKSNAYHAAELLVIPSRHEAMSIVALEAGVCGTPVLLTDQCGFNQLPEAGGGWTAPATVEGLHQALEKILADREARRSAAQKIKAYVHRYYGWDVIVESYKILYARLLSVERL